MWWRALFLRAGFLGLITSACAVFAAAPVITTQPVSQTIFYGDPVTFRVGATGTAPLSYQWFEVSFRQIKVPPS